GDRGADGGSPAPVRPRAGGAVPRGAPRAGGVVLRHPRAGCHVPPGAGDRAPAPAGADRAPRPGPGGGGDGYGVAGHGGGPRPELRRLVGALAPEVRRVVAYHLGFADADGRAITDGGGKAARPALAVLSAEAAGAVRPEEVALPGAVAVELIHNFSLLHDDVVD